MIKKVIILFTFVAIIFKVEFILLQNKSI